MQATGARAEPGRAVTLFLCGDVMTGRGVDQVFARHNEPRLREAFWGGSALDYVKLAEGRNGPIRKPVPPSYVWGDALAELERRKPDARIVNLETAVTTSEDWAPKGINYRMHPANAAVLTAAGIDCCVLANNHMLDFGPSGLVETLETLAGADIAVAGAGLDEDRARAPAIVGLPSGSRVLVFGLGDPSSGVPETWAAAKGRPGLWVLGGLGARQVGEIAGRVAARKRPGDVVVVSLHWGENWGYDVPRAQRDFARGLVDDAGVDVVHGHSSHHPKGLELWHGKPILYGCGDFLNDYEGVCGYEEFRTELSFMYFATLRPGSSSPAGLELVPTRIERFQARRASPEQSRWLKRSLERACAPFGTRLTQAKEGVIRVG